MDEIIRATDAKREFSRVLRDVQEGMSFTVTSHGRVVARIVPADQNDANAARRQARENLFKRLKAQRARNVPRNWTRDDLYD